MRSFVDPDRTQFEAFKALDRDHPIEMLNLVKFRDMAEYNSLPGSISVARGERPLAC